MTEDDRSAYKDGLEAASRIGKYAGFTTVPECPFPEGTQEHADWWDGFSDATDDLIFHNRTE